MIFDWTVSLGNVLTMIGFVAGSMIMVLSMKSDIRILDRRMSETEKDVDKISTAIIETARQSMWLKNLDERVTEMGRRVARLENRGEHNDS